MQILTLTKRSMAPCFLIKIAGYLARVNIINNPFSKKLVALFTGRVENTDPHSADYTLTPAPRTTLRTTPTDYPK